MFLYKNGRLHVGPISVAPPEGFYLDPDTRSEERRVGKECGS